MQLFLGKRTFLSFRNENRILFLRDTVVGYCRYRFHTELACHIAQIMIEVYSHVSLRLLKVAL